LWDDQLEINAKLTLDKVPPTAVALEKENKETDLTDDLRKHDPADWARESYEQRLFAYSTIFKEMPDQAYLDKAKTIADKRIALAGYRLADVLKTIFGHAAPVVVPTRAPHPPPPPARTNSTPTLTL